MAVAGPLSPSLTPTLKNLRYAWFSDPESSFAAVAPTARIKQFRSLVAPRDYLQFVAHLPLHRAQLMAYGSSDVHFCLEEVPLLHLTACFRGTRQVRTPAGDVESRAGGAALLPPGDRDAEGASSTAIVSLIPQEVGQAAGAMAGETDGGKSNEGGWSDFRPQGWGPRTLEARQIHALLLVIDRCAAVDPGLPARLALDDVLHRLVAALLNPSLLQEPLADGKRLRTREGLSAFDDLIAYISANLHHPLRLSDLEARSHYSRRTLQYAFREKLNTTPKQWIRQQRLKTAMEQLQSQGCLSVLAVALECGYLNQSHFCSDFKREFGLCPSKVRRPNL